MLRVRIDISAKFDTSKAVPTSARQEFPALRKFFPFNEPKLENAELRITGFTPNQGLKPFHPNQQGGLS
jgi:hypothetical protein